MNILKEEINNQIEKLKMLICKNASKEEIKEEQIRLNNMLEQYLNNEK